MLDHPTPSTVAEARARANLLRAAALAMVTALAFWAFFQGSKWPVFANANPFADDPVDAIGSIGFEVAVVAGLLSLARALCVYRSVQPDGHRPRLVLHGIAIVLLTLGVTVFADGVQEIRQPGWDVSVWGKVLILGLGGLALLGLVTALALLQATRSLAALPSAVAADGSGWLGEALEDVFRSGWLPLLRLGERVASVGRLARWAEAVWFGPLVVSWRRDLAWASPWTHPWRFALLAGLVAGLGLAAAHTTEGLPPHLWQLALVSAVFVGFEFVATVGGFLVFGGFLGLRPPLFRNSS